MESAHRDAPGADRSDRPAPGPAREPLPEDAARLTAAAALQHAVGNAAFRAAVRRCQVAGTDDGGTGGTEAPGPGLSHGSGAAEGGRAESGTRSRPGVVDVPPPSADAPAPTASPTIVSNT